MRKVLSRRRINRDSSPKVVYLIGLLAYAAWGAWAYVLFELPPETGFNRFLFITALAVAVFFTFIFLFYQTGKALTGRAPEVVFYPAGRRAILLTGYVILMATMRLLGIFTWINAGLLGLILLLIEIQLSRR